ncbi:maleylpyruvate isomerase family mycothiol-dependent enzyme [Actinomadura rifamycini]|uniref:maleylpyruvate isomerase family mycothiol-dependent enzyme n=1 Tax=Actinomadura rifamycini TaxID=31962 RepID=UPI0004791952|nr:maleylpyruvate isomerase family mycothiol-dependent enzyme [Actinomadura rifamycini]
MDHARFLGHLDDEFARFRAAAASGLSAPVPTCPGWTVADLARHVGEVYLEKARTVREGAEPEPWPPPGLAAEDPLALLDRSYPDLRGELAARAPGDPSVTWYGPDQTVGFLMRRMAHETLIHRIDAELGAGRPVGDVPPDLAADGIDELLKVCVAYAVAEWSEEFTGVLGGAPERTYALRTDGAAWAVRSGPDLFDVQDGPGGGPADVTLTGPPDALLRWVWNRGGDVRIEGDPEAVAVLRRCIAIATQ